MADGTATGPRGTGRAGVGTGHGGSRRAFPEERGPGHEDPGAGGPDTGPGGVVPSRAALSVATATVRSWLPVRNPRRTGRPTAAPSAAGRRPNGSAVAPNARHGG